jgi:hypothetical protein
LIIIFTGKEKQPTFIGCFYKDYFLPFLATFFFATFFVAFFAFLAFAIFYNSG